MSSSSPFPYHPAWDGDEDAALQEALRPRRDPYDLNNRIMLTAIISLSLVVLLVISLHIYARYALRRQARRQAIMRQLGRLAHIDIGGSTRSGLHPLVISALPVFVFQQSESQDHAGAVECAVCLSSLEDGETARILPNCNHTFHSQCIDKWLTSHSTCPICRTEAEPRLQPEPREPPAGVSPIAPAGVSLNSPVIEPVSNSNNGGSSSRLSSFRRMLSRERSSRRIQPCARGNRGDIQDLERQ